MDSAAVHTLDGPRELILTPIELLDRLSKLVTPPQQELEFDQKGAGDLWQEMDQTASGGRVLGLR